MKWSSSLATWLETVIDRICWKNFVKKWASLRNQFPACHSVQAFLMIFSVDGIMFKSVTKDTWHRSSQNLSTSLWKGWGTNLTITCWNSKSSQSPIHIHHAQLEEMNATYNQNQSKSQQLTLHNQCPNQEAPTLWRSAPSCVERRPHASAKLSWTWLPGICTRNSHPSSVGGEYVFLARELHQTLSQKKSHPEKSTYSTDFATISSY